MNRDALKKQSQTDYDRLDKITDEEIDTSDIPPLDEEFFSKAKVRLPAQKVPITIRLDADVLRWFKRFGKGYQTHINNVLRTYMEAHQKEAS
jgi:uncharacterized protein (DUF4415 family)